MLVSQMRKRDIVVGSWLKSCISVGGINRLKKHLSVFFILLSRLCKDVDTSTFTIFNSTTFRSSSSL